MFEAAGGVVEFSDLLKRPLDAYRYLQLTLETGELSLRNQTVQTNAMKAGELDLIFLPYRDAPQFVGNPAYNVNIFEGAGTAYVLLYNRTKPPMDNLNLRLAIAHAVSPAAINSALRARTWRCASQYSGSSTARNSFKGLHHAQQCREFDRLARDIAGRSGSERG